MKILITGFNAEQCTRDYYEKKQLQVLLTHYSTIRCLEDMGHEVEQRPVKIGEDLSKYDRVILFLHPMQGFSQYRYDGLWTAFARPDCIMAFDDWQVDQIHNQFKQYKIELTERGDKPFRPYMMDLYYGDSTVEELKSRRSEFVEACDNILAKRNKLMICAFKGGDLSLLKLDWNGEMFQYDPNPYNLNRRYENNYGVPASQLELAMREPEPMAADKERAWIFSSLVQNKTRKWIDKQAISVWPIKYFGAKRGEFKGDRVKEPEMCQIFSKNWGILLPGYYHAGSGWWRGRIQQAMDAGSILVGDEKECRVLGDAFVGYGAHDVEQMDLGQLAVLSKNQRECFYDNHPLDKNIQRAAMTRILES